MCMKDCVLQMTMPCIEFWVNKCMRSRLLTSWPNTRSFSMSKYVVVNKVEGLTENSHLCSCCLYFSYKNIYWRPYFLCFSFSLKDSWKKLFLGFNCFGDLIVSALQGWPVIWAVGPFCFFKTMVTFFNEL